MWKQGDKKIKNKVNSSSNTKTTSVAQKVNKRLASQTSDETTSPCKMPKRAVACSNSKKKSVYMSKKSSVIESKRNLHVEEEIEALHLTAGGEDGRPCRRLTDFTFHDADGKQQPFEMLEVDNIYVSGRILPLEKSANKEKEQGVKCEGFGRIENWAISGYEEGYPVIWLSTDIADYDCIKPSSSYKMFYDHFFAKASACVEVYKKLTSSRGNPSLTLDELLAAVARALTGQKCFSSVASIKDFILSQGEFIFKQLIGLDETSKKSDEKFIELPVLAALRNESYKHEDLTHAQPRSSTGTLKIGPELSDTGNKTMQSGSSNCPEEHDEDLKLARLLNEEEYWHLMKQKKNKASISSSTKFYIKINEDEIVDDYPLPAYYKTSNQETDEYVIFDSGIDKCHIDDLPRSMLHNWALYNADLRLISLELLPMKPCADIDVTIFGSGVMTADDGSGYNFDTDNNHSSSRGPGTSEVDGIPIYLSAIKEWMIEFGSSMVFISIRTDMAWYRLGKPSKQYAPWYDPVLKTARLAVNIITLLKEQRRVARLSFEDVIKRVSEFEKNHAAYISSSLDIVERYLVVHGQIIHQQFSEFPDENIRRCAFVTGITKKMEERHHTKWLVKKKKVLLRNEPNLNPRASAAPVMSKRKVMRATTTMLINRIWGGYYSNHSLEESNEGTVCEVEEADELEEQDGNDEDDVSEENLVVQENIDTPCLEPLQINSCWKSNEIKWEGEPVGKTFSGEALYRRATVHGDEIVVGGAVLVQVDQSDKFPYIYFLEYMYEKMGGTKMFHGRMMLRGSQTVLGNAANERELFLTNECMDFELEDAKQPITAEIRVLCFGHQHRKANADADKIDRVRAEERKRKGLPTEFYCKCLYWPDRGAFFSLPFDEMGLGSGICHSCKLKGTNNKKERIEVNPSMISFVSKGTEYCLDDFIYVSPTHFSAERVEGGRFKSGRNVGLKAFVICQLLEIIVPEEAKLAEISSTRINVRRFFRPEDISPEKAYSSDIREIYYSEETRTIPVVAIEGKCEVKKKNDLPCQQDCPAILDHIFFCEHLYEPAGGSLKQLPAHIKLKYSSGKLEDDDALRKKKGKRSEGENDSGVKTRHEASQGKPLATLDIFAGCGGLSEGLQLSGVSITKWAIEYDEAAGDAFKLNHPESSVFINNCNVILRAVMQKCGDGDDCVSTPEAVEQSSSLCEEEVDNLPLPGQVDFINGGPPCQGFSRMNRFNHSTWSKVQCEMILAFLSFADYYRPKFFLLENVRTFVSFNHGETFRLTLASLLEMGYQVRFGVLEAGAYGVPQSRKRAFIWAASPEESLPEWPEPMHVFAAPELKIRLSQNVYYAAVRSTATGAAFKSLTVRDTIGDLPAVGNGASKISLLYQDDPISWFQKKIRGNMQELSNHISKEMCELNVIRCQRIPKCPGADWRDLPDEKVKLSTGQVVDLIPWCLPNTAKRHNQWKGLFGRLDWEGNFPTSITDPQPMGKVGMCFHPEQDRIVTVRECARSQGFPDSYQFAGNVLQKHRQIGNAVPPPLAYALGMKLKEAIKCRNRSKSK